MPTKSHYLALARQIRDGLNEEGLAFKSYPRRDVTELLREISGEANTRIKTAGMAKEIEEVFRDQGLRFFPKLSETTTGEDIRVWKAGTLAAEVLDLILVPGTTSDQALGNLTQSVSEPWDWSTPFPP